MSMHLTTLARPPRTGRRLMGLALGLMMSAAVAATIHLAAHAGSVKGGIYREGTIPAHKTDTYRYAFKGGEKAEVDVTTDVDAILKVYDQRNHLVALKDLSVAMFSDEIPVVTWQPKKTQTFTLKIINPGKTPVKFGMRTN